MSRPGRPSCTALSPDVPSSDAPVLGCPVLRCPVLRHNATTSGQRVAAGPLAISFVMKTARQIVEMPQTKSIARDSSSICESQRDGKTVLIKTYCGPDAPQSPELLRQRVTQEADMVARLSTLPGMRGRLGTMKIIESAPTQGRLVIEKVSGQVLHERLLAERRFGRGARL